MLLFILQAKHTAKRSPPLPSALQCSDLQQVQFARKERINIADEKMMKRCIFVSLSSPCSLFLSWPSDLSPLHQTQLISSVLLSSACLLREVESRSAVSPRLSVFWAGTGWPLTSGGELIIRNDALISLHCVHLTACVSVLCKGVC